MKTNVCISQKLSPRAPDFGVRRSLLLVGAFLALSRIAALGATVTVTVGNNMSFDPGFVTINTGDTVKWVWNASHHTVTSGAPGNYSGMFNSGLQNAGGTFSYTFANAGAFDYYCIPHGEMGMVGNVKVVAVAAPAAQPLNVSTRLRVQTGEGAMIGGFIITGNVPKKVIVRALGPSITGIAGVLADPTVTLNGSGGVIASNNDWRDTQEAAIQATTIPPTNNLESAIVAALSPGNYTAVVGGKDQSTGVGLVEVYDLDQPADAKLANISTRGNVETGSNVMIGGFILGNGTASAKVIVRALGPSLTNAGIVGVLSDPTLELRDGNGAIVRSNNDWKESQQAEIQQTSIPPANDREAAIVASLPPGAYTAIVAGNGGASGVGLVELYNLP
jgi:plastocyanin